jgi:hypothetical protein
LDYTVESGLCNVTDDLNSSIWSHNVIVQKDLEQLVRARARTQAY